MILLGSQVGTPANWPVDSNFDTMMALKSMPSRYEAESFSKQNKHFSVKRANFPVSAYTSLVTEIQSVR